MPPGQREQAMMHNRRIRTNEEFRTTRLNIAQRRYLERANRSARGEKQVRRGEKEGMTAFTATLRHDTTTRLNEVAKGLKSANLEVVIARGWLWRPLWNYIYDLSEELLIKQQQIDLLIKRGDEEE